MSWECAGCGMKFEGYAELIGHWIEAHDSPDSKRKAHTTALSAGCAVQPVVHPVAERRGGNEVGLEGNPPRFTPSRSEGVNPMENRTGGTP
jgi:hypothetical protein